MDPQYRAPRPLLRDPYLKAWAARFTFFGRRSGRLNIIYVVGRGRNARCVVAVQPSLEDRDRGCLHRHACRLALVNVLLSSALPGVRSATLVGRGRRPSTSRGLGMRVRTAAYKTGTPAPVRVRLAPGAPSGEGPTEPESESARGEAAAARHSGL